MKLIYITPDNKEKDWYVTEIEAGKRYGLVDENGKDWSIPVEVKKDRAYQLTVFNGFVIENDEVRAVAMIAGIPTNNGVVVGYSPKII